MEFPDYVVLYDGHCNLCNGTVRFLLKVDRSAKLHFCALQSDLGRKLTPDFRQKASCMETIVFMRKGEVHYFSNAVLEIMKTIGFPWNLTSIFYILPVCVRNFFYRIVAKSRIKLFGRTKECKILDSKYANRFIS